MNDMKPHIKLTRGGDWMCTDRLYVEGERKGLPPLLPRRVAFGLNPAQAFALYKERLDEQNRRYCLRPDEGVCAP